MVQKGSDDKPKRGRGRPKKNDKDLKYVRGTHVKTDAKHYDRKFMCSFLNLAGTPCRAAVTHKNYKQTGQNFCRVHWNKMKEGRLSEMDAMAVNFKIDQLARKTGKPPVHEPLNADVKSDPAKAEAYVAPTVEDTAYEVAGGNRIRFAEIDQESREEILNRQKKNGGNRNGNFKTGTKTKGPIGLDYKYYTGDYKNDHVYLLDIQIIRTHALVNMLWGELKRIEYEEALLKKVETRGTQIGEDGMPVEFASVTTRHVTPIETKLKLIETMQKAEANYRALLKQKEELLVTALTVMRKLGVRWSRDAGMMVVDAIERNDFNSALVLPAHAGPTAFNGEILHGHREPEMKVETLEQINETLNAESMPFTEDQGW